MKLLMISLAVLVLGGSSVWFANSNVTDPKHMKEVKPEIGEMASEDVADANKTEESNEATAS